MENKNSLKNALLKVCELLEKAEIKGSRRESAMILSEILGKSIEYLYAHSEDEISDENLEKSLNFAEKRASGMPMAYVLSRKDFFGLKFKVNSNTLIPRPETEMIVDEALEWINKFKKDERLLILDIGTGSGCIPIAIAKNINNEDIKFIATDISKYALEIAKENAKMHKIDNRINFVKSDLFDSVDCSILQIPCSMLITANLPYLSEKIYDNSPVSVQDFEPKEALISGNDGLDHYRRLLDEINKFVILNKTRKVSGVKSLSILLEISPEQKELIENLIKEKFGDKKIEVSVKKDLAGKWRLVLINFKIN